MQRVNEIVDRTGPFVSVYLPIESAVEDSVDRMSARWSNIRRDLEGQGAEGVVLDVVESTVLDLTGSDARGLAVVADHEGSMLTQLSDEEPGAPLARWSPVPSIVPLLAWRAADISHLLVITDREGADMWVRGARGENPGDARREVDGDTEHIHRGHPGGWSQQRFQQRAENTWDDNAAGVASEVHELAERVGAELIVVTGDERAVSLLEEHLPPPSRDRLRTVDAGARSDPEAVERVAHEADHLVSDLIARREVDILDRFATARGHGLSVEGAEATLEALSENRVETLLVHDDPDDDRTGWAGPGGLPAAAERSVITDLGIEPIKGRLVDVAVRAAVGTGAAIHVVPAHGSNVPKGRLGGILRG